MISTAASDAGKFDKEAKTCVRIKKSRVTFVHLHSSSHRHASSAPVFRPLVIKHSAYFENRRAKKDVLNLEGKNRVAATEGGDDIYIRSRGLAETP